MKRKGFTLVELLIVVAILGALAAVMTVSSGDSITKAKATAIANNLRICTTGAQLYYLENGDNESVTMSSIKAKDVLDAKVPNFTEFSSGTIEYDSTDITTDGETPPHSWAVTVTLSGSDATSIITSLASIKGFSGASGSSVTYKIFDGTLE